MKLGAGFPAPIFIIFRRRLTESPSAAPAHDRLVFWLDPHGHDLRRCVAIVTPAMLNVGLNMEALADADLPRGLPFDLKRFRSLDDHRDLWPSGCMCQGMGAPGFSSTYWT